MNIVLPALLPVSISASMIYWCNLFTIYLVPLQCPFCGSRFRKSMVGLPTFIFRMCVGNPEGVNLFRNYTGYNLSLFIILKLMYFF